MTAPDKILELVERFERNKAQYTSSKYNETQTRREFIDPMFKALGWDIDNERGYAERYKEVIHEDAVKIGGASKAPDYSFRIGEQRKFFVEAKKPSVNLKDDIAPAFQVRRYAWSAKLPVSILTDFEEFAVYDCRNKPVKSDGIAAGRVMYFTCEQYPEVWDQIAGIFSRDAVLKGDFDRYVGEFASARGTQEVDDAFLSEIESWREELARNLALRNEGLTQRELNFAVQRIIDRIIFLRIGEDRGFEPYGQLQDLTKGEQVYPALVRLFRRADDRYNSGLFHFKHEAGRSDYPDELTPGLTLDDKVLKAIFRNLYYPDSPYEFSVLPADILGQVYEQFLGKVIRLTEGHRAKVEEKPEVKKAGGVYYTPTYIVDYIVRNTVGKLLEGKTPRQARGLRILDPACGSGSFLIGAYHYLLDWYLNQYLESDIKADRQRIVQVGEDDYRLTLEEKKAILLDNIYGVDIDSQAVEVTKLSLLLKVLEGEAQSQMQMFQERVLPALDENIKCGNSLIGPDFYEGAQTSMFDLDAEERYRINVFDWQAEFTEIMEAGGFDAVIGNPPYLFITHLQKFEKDYFAKNYSTFQYRYDIYGIFIEKSFTELLKNGGVLGFIIPHTLMNNDSFLKLRSYLVEETFLEKIIDIGPGVFVNANNETMILIAKQNKSSDETKSILIKSDRTLASFENVIEINQKLFLKFPSVALLIPPNPESIELLVKMRSIPTSLGDFCTINQGLRTGNNSRFLIKEKTSLLHKPVIGGRDIKRYYLEPSGYVNYDKELLDAPRDESIFTSPEKILIQEVRNITLERRIIASYDNRQLYALQTTNVINLVSDLGFSIKYILGLLNSRLINWFFKLSFQSNNHIASNQLQQIPIIKINFDIPDEVMEYDQMVSLVETMISLHKQLAEANTPQEKQALQRQIEATDARIDALVYQLYGLTDEEISIVEEAVG